MFSPPAIIGRFTLIAVCAGITACFPLVLYLLLWEPAAASDPGQVSYLFGVFQIALLGSFAVGLPVALVVYFLAARQLARWPSAIFLSAALASIMIILTSFLFADEYAALLFGVPGLFAAMTFAALGWFWVIKPQREALCDRA